MTNVVNPAEAPLSRNITKLQETVKLQNKKKNKNKKKKKKKKK